ncbi:MAG TPA: sulfurtransferase TusA family protein [Ktedonobacterales bacterium]|nr:sulfurtransferase TusA family protein [Ktedonobacterales bacterium]
MSVERGTSDAVLDMTQTPAAQGAMCALLTPAIKAKLREMTGGQILEIRVNDPTARQDIESWCRLAGHQVIAITEVQGLLRVYLRKKPGS